MRLQMHKDELVFFKFLYSQSFVYCHVFVLLIIDYSTKKGVLVYSRKCASEILYFRSNLYRKAVRVNVLADIALL